MVRGNSLKSVFSRPGSRLHSRRVELGKFDLKLLLSLYFSVYEKIFPT